MCPNFVDHLFSISSDSILLLSFLSPSQTGAVGHADSLSPFFCRRGNCHPLSFSPLSTVWRMYACVCARVLGRLWQCGARRKTGFISSAINRWMHVDSHTFGLLWMTKARSFPISTWRDRALSEGSLRPDWWAAGRKESGSGSGFGLC